VPTIRFRLGKIPVQIAPSFLLVAVVFGLSGMVGDNPDFVADLKLRAPILVAWVVIVFVSVLLHELGHATMGLAFGLEPRIELHGMGGTTSWSSARPLSTGRRILISLAGPGAGFVLAAIVYFALGPGVFPPTPLGTFAYQNLLFVNFVWGLANLVPMLPLDGGNVMVQSLNALTGGRGERPARYVSIGVAVLAVPAGLLLMGNWWAAILALSFVGVNVQGLRDLAAREQDGAMRPALEQAYAALRVNDGAKVLALARPVALGAKAPAMRAEALQLLAFGFLLEGRVPDADAAVAALPRDFQVDQALVEMRSRFAR
jgi:Zn-dependent protease